MCLKSISLAGVVLLLLSACSSRDVLVASPGQIGAGATITREGANAKLVVPPSAKWPDGWTETLTVVDAGGFAPTGSQRRSFKTSKNTEIAFIGIGREYVCRTCLYLDLPLSWQLLDK